MDSFLICITLLVLSLSGYILWPSRYNVIQHLGVGGSFVAIVVPALILNVQDVYSQRIVDLYVWILVIGAITFLLGSFLGFFAGGGVKTRFSFDVMDSAAYEMRTIQITRYLMFSGIIGMILSYMIMGFIPMFAVDPISAKLFRGEYQEPYKRVAILYRASFYILSTIIPIACIIWYKNKSNFFLFATVAALLLMAISLTRSGAFMGVVFAVAIIMSFKSRYHFMVFMALLVGIFVLSSYFYYLVGVRSFSGDKSIWEIITAGTPDIQDQLDFMTHFENNPVWTYGRTIYGGLIPGHYKWNPAVYTLIMVNPGQEINNIGSGGLRLPLPIWGYVSFGWAGVVAFCFSTGLLSGVFIRVFKGMIFRFDSMIIRTIAIVAFCTVFGIVVNFTQLSMYNLPPALVCLLYLYRFKWK